jgi:cephalosporin hydroxylase
MIQRMLQRLRSEADGLLRRPIARAYHRNWYTAGNTWTKSKWMGFPLQQCPFDLQRYQELLHSLRPRAIVQTGINQGGSLLFFAHLLDAIGAPNDGAIVVGIDIEISAKAKELKHPRIRLIEGDSKDVGIVKQVRQFVGERTPVIVSLDSDHRYDHVLAELRVYAPLVSSGGALVVEDTNMNGHPVLPNFGSGPREALAEWRRENPTDKFVNVGAEADPNWFSFHSWFERR